MFVEMWMNHDPITVEPNATISFAAMEMSRRKVRHLLVTESLVGAKRLVGIVSKYDLPGAFPANLNPFSIEVFEETVPRAVSAIMARNIRSTTPDTPIEEAARLLRAHKIGALPVLRGSRLLGIITESDIFDAFIAMTGAHGGGMRITLEMSGEESLLPAMTELGRRYGVRLVSFFSYGQNKSENSHALCTFRVSGGKPADFVEHIWKSGCRVLSAIG